VALQDNNYMVATSRDERIASPAEKKAMIRSLQIANFRGFHRLDVDGFAKINILVGRSASGKTAFLEAIRLALGATPQVAWAINSQRMFQFVPPNPTRAQFEAAWSALFFDFRTDETISLRAQDDQGRKASLAVFFDKQNTLTLPSIPDAPSLPPTTISPLTFQRSSFDGEDSTVVASVTPQGSLNLGQGAELGAAVELITPWPANVGQASNWFSQLSIANQEHEIVEAVCKQFHEITGLTVEAPIGSFPVLYATVRHRNKKLPVSLVSSGLNKFVSLVIALKANANGTVLIDEVENGIYYQMYGQLWEAIDRFSAESKTQLFLTTHSWECLRSVAPLIERSPDRFALLQLNHEGDDTGVSIVAGKNAAAAIEGGIEVRG